MENLNLVLPEIFISLAIMFLLILGVFKKDSSKLIHNFSLIILLITGGIIFNETLTVENVLLFNGSIVIDITGGMGLLSYYWLNGLGNSDSLYALSDSVYSLIVIDSVACVDTFHFVLQSKIFYGEFLYNF